MDKQNDIHSDIRIAAIAPRGGWHAFLSLIGPACDRLLGVRQLRLLYERRDFRGRVGQDFLEHFLKVNKIRYRLDEKELRHIPQTGPVVLVGNHPLGGLEGILLARILRLARPDYKILVNIMLYFIKELEEFFIFTNPMAPGSRGNFKAVGLCRNWLREKHCLLIFPAGRVGLYREDKGYITDEAWDQSALTLAKISAAPIIPIFVGGSCSKRFSWMCRLFYPAKLLWLVREFIHSFGKEIFFSIGRPIPLSDLDGFSKIRSNAWLRMCTYLLAPLESSLPDNPAEQVLPLAVPSGLSEPTTPADSCLDLRLGDVYSPKARALIAAALAPQDFTRYRKRFGSRYFHQPYVLHREVQDYIRRHGLTAKETNRLLAWLGEPVSLPAEIARLLDDTALPRQVSFAADGQVCVAQELS